MLCFPMLISSLPDANPLPPEHKIEVFVLFWPSGPPFSGISSTKSAFLCQNWQFSPGFCPFRAQNRKRLRDYVLTPIYEASTFAEKH